jgi:hypothetical protein
MCITTTLHTLKKIVYENTGIVASVSEDGYENNLMWWDDGVLNSLSVWSDDNSLHFSQHEDGHLLRECVGVVSYLHDEIVYECYIDGARCAFSVWPEEDMWVFVAHKNGELIRTQSGTISS